MSFLFFIQNLDVIGTSKFIRCNEVRDIYHILELIKKSVVIVK